MKGSKQEVEMNKGKAKCPYCGSTNTSEYIYGFPVLDDEMKKQIESGEIILGGCEIDPSGSMPERKCIACGKDFQIHSETPLGTMKFLSVPFNISRNIETFL